VIRNPAHAVRLFETSRDLLVVLGPDTRILSVSPSWERVLGHPADALMGTPIAALLHPDDVERTTRELAQTTAGRPTLDYENRYRHADGHHVWLRWSSASNADGLIYGAARDVTEERRAVEDARAAIARLEEAQRVARVGSWEQDLRTGERRYTREMFAIQGMDPEVDEPWGVAELLERVVPEHHARIRDAVARLRTEPGPQRVEYRMLSPVERVIVTVMEAERDAGGTPVLVRGTTQDVTELRENERHLAEAERVAGMGSFEWRMSDSRLHWSPGTYRLYGMDPSGPPVTPERFYGLMLPEEAARAKAVLTRAATETGTYELEYSLPTGVGGRRLEVLGRAEAYRSGDDVLIRGTIQDVTQMRRVVHQQQEISRLGQMALAGTDVRDLFEEVCQVVTRALGTDMVTILALQGDDSLAFAASLGFGDAAHGTAIPADQDSIARQALAAGRPMIVSDWLAEERFPYSPQLRGNGVRCTAVLPIRGKDAPFGVLATHSATPGVVDAQQNFAFLDALATFLATAIERLRHEAEIAALAALRGRLVAENLEAEERARRRISEELHDGALQDLLAARQDLVEAAGSGDGTTRHEMLGYAREGVERAVKLLREAVHALHPVVLQHGGLEAAMRAAADQAARVGGFTPDVSVEPGATGLRDELVMSLARELLSNCAKHAGARHVGVTVARDGGALVLEVADDGRGLDAAEVAAAPLEGHIGLASLIQRVQAVGGTVDLDGARGRGTTVRARLPTG
jgi:two-component system NarL family sensor kinase